MLVCHNHYPYSLCLSYYYGQNFLKIAMSQKEATMHIWAMFVRDQQRLCIHHDACKLGRHCISQPYSANNGIKFNKS